MIEIKVDKGQTRIEVKGNSLSKLIAEAFCAIEGVYQAFDKHDHEDADTFKLMFYKAAEDKVFFNQKYGLGVISEDDPSPEQELKRNLMKGGCSEETSDELVKFAKQLNDLLHKAAREACDD